MAPAHKDDTLNQREATNFFHCGLSYDGREEEDDMGETMVVPGAIPIWGDVTWKP